jgi:hypothetical protein
LFRWRGDDRRWACAWREWLPLHFHPHIRAKEETEKEGRKEKEMNQITAAQVTQVTEFKATFNAALYDAPFGNRLNLYLNTHLTGLGDMTLVEINDPRTCTASLVRRVIDLIGEAGDHLV